MHHSANHYISRTTASCSSMIVLRRTSIAVLRSTVRHDPRNLRRRSLRGSHRPSGQGDSLFCREVVEQAERLPLNLPTGLSDHLSAVHFESPVYVVQRDGHFGGHLADGQRVRELVSGVDAENGLPGGDSTGSAAHFRTNSRRFDTSPDAVTEAATPARRSSDVRHAAAAIALA